MDQIARDIVPIRIEDEMRNSYMDYSMSVIIGRALPDIRDGLKPVHRRILYAMHSEGMQSNKRYAKCAGVVGEVLKRYHPHGDSAVYDALVRMAQPWNLRYLLVDGQGNFGSVDGDAAAAYRYTECRMTKLAEELLVDIDKETVSFSPNFDDTIEEPDVLPARFPNLLVNGADGIAVGMATKIPPHNLGEIIDACVALIDDPELPFERLHELVPGPDFPTGATIYGREGVRDAYQTGRGRVVIRGKARFEELKNGRRAIVIDEIPYQVNKARLIEQIADLVRHKRLDGIHALRDESDRRGMRVVVELKHDVYEEVVLNHLYKHTPLQTTFGVILLSIVDQRPRILPLAEMLRHYIIHRREVIRRRTRYELRKARERAHILEGYRIALDHIDEVIALIRSSPDVATARAGLMERFGLSEIQANAILDMRLQRLTGLEREKIEEEYRALLVRIGELEEILGSEVRLMAVVKEELVEVRGQFADPRRTDIVEARGELTIRDLVAEEDQVVTLSHLGYIKRCRVDEWRMQQRGGMGKRGMRTRDEDFVSSLFIANTHDTLLVFTSSGKVYPLAVHEVPETSRGARGRPIVNLVALPREERITGLVTVREIEGEEGGQLLFISRKGLVKRTELSKYRYLRQGGLIAAGVAEDDELLIVRHVASEDVDVMLMTKEGQCIRFPLDEVPLYSRTARGNRGIRLGEVDEVVDALLVPAGGVVEEEDEEEEALLEEEAAQEDAAQEELDEPPAEAWDSLLLTVTQGGFGKRVPFDRYRVQRRYGKGVIAVGSIDQVGTVVGALQVAPEDEVMLVTDTGRVIRIAARSVRVLKGRSSRGVRLMRLDEEERIVDLARLEETDAEEIEETAGESPEDAEE